MRATLAALSAGHLLGVKARATILPLLTSSESQSSSLVSDTSLSWQSSLITSLCMSCSKRKNSTLRHAKESTQTKQPPPLEGQTTNRPSRTTAAPRSYSAQLQGSSFAFFDLIFAPHGVCTAQMLFSGAHKRARLTRPPRGGASID
jgi:hypothetical protein